VLFPYMDRKTPGLGQAHAPMADGYREELELLARTPNALVIARPADAVQVGRLEQNVRIVTRGAMEGATAVHQALAGCAPRSDA
jgi:hypothetical protein